MNRQVFLMILGVILTSQATVATMVEPELVKCPICEKQFVISVLVSYSTFGPPAHDFSDGPRCGKPVETCPHCLYSATQYAFWKPHLEDAERVRATLPDMPARLAEEMKSLRKYRLPDHMLETMTTTAIALDCRRICRSDPRQDVRILLDRYYTIKNWVPEALVEECRTHVVDALGQGLQDGIYTGLDEATMTYLRSELLRRSGRIPEALDGFRDANRLFDQLRAAGSLNEQTNWLAELPQEHILRVAFSLANNDCLEVLLRDAQGTNGLWPRFDLPTRAALAVLDGRCGDTGAQEVSKRFEQQSPVNCQGWSRMWSDEYHGCSATLLRNALPGLLQAPLCREHRLDKGESLLDQEHEFGLDRGRLVELNPGFAEFVGPLGEEVIRVPNIPEGFTESTMLDCLPELLGEGNLQAGEWFVKWLKNRRSIEPLDYQSTCCLEALSRTPTLWPLARDLQSNGQEADQVLLIECLAYVCRQGPLTENMRSCIAPRDGNHARRFLVLNCLGTMRNSLAKAEVLAMLDGKVISYARYWHELSYLAAVGDESDLPYLRRLAEGQPREETKEQKSGPHQQSQESLNSRQHLEGAIRTILLRSRLWTTDATAGSQPANEAAVRTSTNAE